MQKCHSSDVREQIGPSRLVLNTETYRGCMVSSVLPLGRTTRLPQHLPGTGSVDQADQDKPAGKKTLQQDETSNCINSWSDAKSKDEARISSREPLFSHTTHLNCTLKILPSSLAPTYHSVCIYHRQSLLVQLLLIFFAL